MSGYHERFLGAEELPRTLSDFDVERFFELTPADVLSIKERFRADRRLGPALQLVFLRATGRPLNRLAVVPKALLRSLAKALDLTPTTIATLRSIYRRRETLYDHQRWAREQLGLAPFDKTVQGDLQQELDLAARDAVSIDDLVGLARRWLQGRKVMLAADSTLRDVARAAYAQIEQAALQVVEAAVPAQEREICEAIMFHPTSESGGETVMEWLKAPPAKHSPSTLNEVLGKIAVLKRLGADRWNLDGIALARQRAYAQAIVNRPPSESRRRKDSTQAVEMVCFLRITLLELSDTALYLAGRRVSDLVRRATSKSDGKRAQSAVDYRQRLVSIRQIVNDTSRTAEQRLEAIAAQIPDELDAVPLSGAALTRRTLTDEPVGVRALLDGMRGLDFAADPKDTTLRQWNVWSALRETGAKELPVGDEQPSVGSAWSDLVGDADRTRALRAFEASTMMAMRKALRRGSVWLDHSLSFRDRDSLLIPAGEWERDRDHYLALLDQPASADAMLEPLLANVRAGLAAVSEAVAAGELTIGADGQLHLPALQALDEDIHPKKTSKALFEAIGEQQFPDLLIELDAQTNFSEALLGHKAGSSEELLATYAALLAHGTEVDAKGVAAMIPSLKPSQVTAAMRSLQAPGRLRRANERVVEFQRKLPLAELWGPGDRASADMMALDASQHLWNARVDPRRRTYAAGIYTHVLDRYGIVYDQPIVLNERQAGAAIEGVVRHNTAQSADQLARLSLLAVDTHGYTHAGMTASKVVGFDLCPRLRNLSERKLYVPNGWVTGKDFDSSIEAIVDASVALRPVRAGWDGVLRIGASVVSGLVSAPVALRHLGEAAAGDQVRRAADQLGRLLRTVFLCDYFTNRAFRRELHTLLNRGEAVHQLQRAIYYGKVAPERGRRPDEMVAISGAHALLTNVVIAWNTSRMQQVVDRWRKQGMTIEDAWLRRLGPVHFGHINFRGVFSFGIERYADALIQARRADTGRTWA